MTTMEEREQKNNEGWSKKIALSEAFFSIIDTKYSRSNRISGSPGSILAKDIPALAVSERENSGFSKLNLEI